jgi:hypothetical protein
MIFAHHGPSNMLSRKEQMQQCLLAVPVAILAIARPGRHHAALAMA